MGIALMLVRQRGGTSLVVVGLMLIAMLVAAPAPGGDNRPTALSPVEAKAFFLYNVVKFAEWPAQPVSDSIAICIVGDEPIAAALAATVRGKNIDGHPLRIERPTDSGTWQACELLFIADAQTGRSSVGLRGIKALPVLTVSDGPDFSQTGGMIEFFVEDGRMRFLVNLDAVERSGLHLSSRFLGLAKVTPRRVDRLPSTVSGVPSL